MGRVRGSTEAHLQDHELEGVITGMRASMPELVLGGIKADATKLFNECASKGSLAMQSVVDGVLPEVATFPRKPSRSSRGRYRASTTWSQGCPCTTAPSTRSCRPSCRVNLKAVSG